MFNHFRIKFNTSLFQEFRVYTDEPAGLKYPKMTAFDLLMQELEATGMAVGT